MTEPTETASTSPAATTAAVTSATRATTMAGHAQVRHNAKVLYHR